MSPPKKASKMEEKNFLPVKKKKLNAEKKSQTLPQTEFKGDREAFTKTLRGEEMGL